MSGLNQKHIIFTGNCNTEFAKYIREHYNISTEKIQITRMNLTEALSFRKEAGEENVMIFDIEDNAISKKYGFNVKSITYGYKNPKVFKLLCDWIYKEIRSKWAKYLK